MLPLLFAPKLNAAFASLLKPCLHYFCCKLKQCLPAIKTWGGFIGNYYAEYVEVFPQLQNKLGKNHKTNLVNFTKLKTGLGFL